MSLTRLFPEDGRYFQRTAPTPLVPVQLEPSQPVSWCKLEFLNPSGSTKDRIARHMLEKAWRRGDVTQGGWVVEASSGSTSLALALACAQLDLRFLAVMPEGVSNERVLSIKAYGGEVISLDKSLGMEDAINRAEHETRERGGITTRQFENPDNSEAHRLWTAQEILSQIPGNLIEGVVSGVGTGGTLVGLFEGIFQSGCDVTPFLARPVSHAVISEVECCSFSKRLQGVMDGTSSIFSLERLPGLVEISTDDEDAIETTHSLIHHGFPVGPSSGLNLAAAHQAVGYLLHDANVVTVFPDRMDRYFSTELFGPYQ
ncbi:PLP-dependent cysteine synthase family protein [Halomonas sp. MA07-2]|uniref:PLP-dependent cysteine synthase family protein n=1 Tax=unclassified Halomonas TaxID=2609666 RepID=UPI003EEC6B77